MAPNPVLIPRQRARDTTRKTEKVAQRGSIPIGLITITILIVTLARTHLRIRRWIYSGTAIECLLLTYGSFRGEILTHDHHLWISLAILNFSFSVSSTSWLLQPFFATGCYLAIILTCFSLFPATTYLARLCLKYLSPRSYIFQDKIAYFNVPALEIDTEVNGLFVVRGITFSVSDFAIEAHGLELGLRLSDDVELALCADHLVVRLFRNINLSDVYGNLKVSQNEKVFSAPGSGESDSHRKNEAESKSIFTSTTSSRDSDASRVKGGETPSKGHVRDESIPKKQPQDARISQSNSSEAEQGYETVLEEVKHSSQIHTAQAEVERGEHAQKAKTEREMRQAVCAKLQDVPAISHKPPLAVKVSVLQTIFPRLRRFLHRLPLLLRLLLNPLSYFHPIYISSVSVAGPGDRLKGLVQDHLIQDEAEHDEDMKQLEEEMSSWLSTATFCFEMSEVSALGHTPVTSTGEITAYLRTGDLRVYRTPLDSNTVTEVTHLGGADATVVIPAFLLPHHEHCLPPVPVDEDAEAASNHLTSDYMSEIVARDKTEITISAHASLPTTFDQSLLDFAATFLKATKMIDLENLFERQVETDQSANGQSTSASNDPNRESSDATANGKEDGQRDEASQNDQQNHSSTMSKITNRMPQSVKTGVKKALKHNVVSDKVNDRWVARSVGRIAARLEEAKGDFGYTTVVPLSLRPYREAAESPSKILP